MAIDVRSKSVRVQEVTIAGSIRVDDGGAIDALDLPPVSVGETLVWDEGRHAYLVAPQRPSIAMLAEALIRTIMVVYDLTVEDARSVAREYLGQADT